MANLLEVANDVVENLDDLSANFFSNVQDIQPSIQDGYNLTIGLTESIESYADVPFQAGLVFYDFSSYIPNYLRIFGIFNNATNRWMYPTSLLDLYKLRDNWELAVGDPYLFLPIDFRTVAIFPAMAATTGTMTVLFKAKADVLTANSEVQLPLEHQNILEWYATADLLEQAQEFVKASDYSQMFDKGIEDVKKVLRNRTSPNHLYYKHDA